MLTNCDTISKLERSADMFQAIMTDISNFSQEEEGQKLAENILKEKLENLTLISGGVAHNFNNILTVINGYAELTLAELPHNSPFRDYMEEILKATRQGSDITRKLLTCAGKTTLPVKEINLSELVHNMINTLESSIPEKATLQYEFSGDIPDIKGDEIQIKKLITNLVSNASEATEEHGGLITVRVGTVECDRSYFSGIYGYEDLSEGLYVYLEVSDTGFGIDMNIQDKIFDPFFTTKFTGRGLGLAEVSGIMRMHHGAIRVCSEQGYGTTFRLLFPVFERAFTVYGKISEDKTFSSGGTILVVDDEKPVLTMAKTLIERNGFKALIASTGFEAVEMFSTYSDMVKAVLLDMSMPDMDGKEIFYMLKKICNDVKVIFSSGYNEEVVPKNITDKGVFGFIQKPYRAKDLMEIICKAVNNGAKNLSERPVFTEQYIG